MYYTLVKPVVVKSVSYSNIRYCCMKACAGEVNAAGSRDKLSTCDIIVATHGAFLDLLQHFRDLFCMERINLLILDECHNCTGTN